MRIASDREKKKTFFFETVLTVLYFIICEILLSKYKTSNFNKKLKCLIDIQKNLKKLQEKYYKIK